MTSDLAQIILSQKEQDVRDNRCDCFAPTEKGRAVCSEWVLTRGGGARTGTKSNFTGPYDGHGTFYLHVTLYKQKNTMHFVVDQWSIQRTREIRLTLW